jgi:hypothetical protein
METLVIKNKANTKSLTQTLFKSEEEFEKLVFNTPELLSDIFLIKRQVRGSNKSGIPDIIGIDEDGNICIIEMKNVTVDSDIIPQVLEYALWAEKYPDSIKSLWLECEEKPEDLEIDWDDTEIRIVIIAPKIQNSTLEFVNKINYVVDLFEVRQYVDNDIQYLFLNKLEAERNTKKIKPIRGLIEYSEEYYKTIYNPNSVPEFIRYTKELEKIINEREWNLETKYNKKYCAFKYGFTNVFSVQWIGTKSFSFRIKISEEESKNSGIKITKYSKNRKTAIYYIEPGKTKTSEFIELFELAYRKLLV